MAGRALEVIVGLGAERVRLVVTVEEADSLLHTLRDAQNSVGDVCF